MKSTEKLINELSKAHTSVVRNYSPLARSVLSLYALSAMIITSFYLIRPFSYTIQNFNHGIELFTLFLLLNAITYLGFQSFVPGEKKKTTLYVVIITTGLFILSLVSRLFVAQTFNVVRPYCELEAMAISIITTSTGHLLLRKNEFALNNIMSKFIFLSLPMTAVIFLHGVCSLKLPHVLICHVMASLMIPTLYLSIINRKKV